MRRSTKTILIVGLVIAAVIAFLALASSLLTTAEKVDDTKFFEYAGVKWGENEPEYAADSVKIDKIVLDGNTLRGYSKTTKNTYVQKYYAYYYNISTWEKEIEVLKKNGVVFDTTDPNSGAFFSSTVVPVLMIGIALFAVFFLIFLLEFKVIHNLRHVAFQSAGTVMQQKRR